MKAEKARLDTSGTAKPLTRLTAQVEPGKLHGPGISPVSYRLEDTKAPYGWTVIRRDNDNGFFVYERDCPADEAHYAADLAPFTFATKNAAIASGRRGHFAYRV